MKKVIYVRTPPRLGVETRTSERPSRGAKEVWV